jgi:Ca2+-binding RTX toxin-like protein
VTAEAGVTVLYVKGDEAANDIVVECRGGFVLVNGIAAVNGNASCADLRKLDVFAGGGDDVITLLGIPTRHQGSDLGGLFSDEYEEETSVLVDGGQGNDNLSGDVRGEVFDGGPGSDVLRARGPSAAVMAGGPGGDRLLGHAGGAIMLGGGGADRMDVSSFLTLAFTGAGADVFSGGPGFDLAFGGKGRDTLVGQARSDLLGGGAGRDAAFGGPGRDTLVGGRGRDKLRGGPDRDRVFEAGLPAGELKHLPVISLLVDAGRSFGAADRQLRRLTRVLRR